MTVEIQRMIEVPLREVWHDESRVFTPWLAENVEYLSEALGMDLELIGTEMPVGPFFADIVLVDLGSERRVVVENFLGATDHDHLGKLITYAAGLEGSYAVLVARLFRPEHRSALTWLNENTASDAGFFGLEVHAVRIGDSAPAVRFDVVVEPDEWRRKVRERPRLSDTQQAYLDWWSEFIPALQAAHPGWTNNLKPSTRNHLRIPIGPGLRYGVSFAWPEHAKGYTLRVTLHMEDGDKWWPRLEPYRREIDAALGGVAWERLDGSKASRISVYHGDANPLDRAAWPTYRSWAIETLGRVREVLQPLIDATAP